jgi:uncharacterized membrane protein YobD (UPF0266 family)
VQEGRSLEAEGRREESLYSKVFNLFSVVGYFCLGALVINLLPSALGLLPFAINIIRIPILALEDTIG